AAAAQDLHRRVVALDDAGLARDGPALCQQLAKLLAPPGAKYRRQISKATTISSASNNIDKNSAVPQACAAAARLLCRAAAQPGLARDLAASAASLPRLVDHLAARIRSSSTNFAEILWLAPAMECAIQRFPAQCGHVRGRLEGALIRLLDLQPRLDDAGAAEVAAVSAAAERLWSLLPKLGSLSAEDRATRWSELHARCLDALDSCLRRMADCAGGSGFVGEDSGQQQHASPVPPSASAAGLLAGLPPILADSAGVRACVRRAAGLLAAVRALLDCPAQLTVAADVGAAADLAERLVSMRPSAATSEARCLATELPSAQVEANRLLSRLAGMLGLGACLISPQLAGALHASLEAPMSGPLRLAAYELLAAWLDSGRSVADLALLPGGGLRGLVQCRLVPDAAAAVLARPDVELVQLVDVDVLDRRRSCGAAALRCLARLVEDFRPEPAVARLLWRRLAGPLAGRLVSGARPAPTADLAESVAEFLSALGRCPLPCRPWPVELLALALRRLGGAAARRPLDGLRDRLSVWASPPLWTDGATEETVGPPVGADDGEIDEEATAEAGSRPRPQPLPPLPQEKPVEEEAAAAQSDTEDDDEDDRPPPAKIARLSVSADEGESNEDTEAEDEAEADEDEAFLTADSQVDSQQETQRAAATDGSAGGVELQSVKPEGGPSVMEMLDSFVDND
ncbi:hypothetical protein BOX15_Mlig019673g6, partial [Macrostomum lignano]